MSDPTSWTITGIVLVLFSMRVALGRHAVAGAGPGHLHRDPSHGSTVYERN